jgi:hypothetical protein
MPAFPKEIEGYSIERLLKVAENNVLKKTKDTLVLDAEAEERIPKFERSGKTRHIHMFLTKTGCRLSL